MADVTDTHCQTPTSIPDVRRRPSLDRWLRDRCMDDAAAAQLFGCTKQRVNQMRQPFDHPGFKPPGRRLLTVIVRMTHGGVRPGDFSPPVEDILAGRAAA